MLYLLCIPDGVGKWGKINNISILMNSSGVNAILEDNNFPLIQINLFGETTSIPTVSAVVTWEAWLLKAGQKEVNFPTIKF